MDDGVVKIAKYCVAQNYLVIAAYSCTPHSSKFVRLAFDDFYIAIVNSDLSINS